MLFERRRSWLEGLIYLNIRTIFALGTCASTLISLPVFAQMPEGQAIPPAIETPGDSVGQARIAINPGAKVYRYHADYNITGIVGDKLKIAPYAFADADIEAQLFTDSNEFHPDKLTGTFEVGLAHEGSMFDSRIFLRHQSSHNVDRTDRVRPAWEMVGMRFESRYRSTHMSLGVARYTHKEAVHYNTDVDFRTSTPIGSLGRKPILVDTVVHNVQESGGPRSGFTDFWIEPSIELSQRTSVYLGYGTIHDVDTSNGQSDRPFAMGLRFRL